MSSIVAEWSRRARLAAVACALAPLGGCYVLQAASGQAQVLARSEPIEQVIADPGTPAATRERLELARDARAFAVRELGLPDGRSYQAYADLGRRYVVWNVVATPEYSVRPVRWCYPVAGCVAYRGYFDEDAARAAAGRLQRSGHDVAVGGVATYSTLGHLPDPLFNTMLDWRETRFVGTIFHELAHERLYVPGDSEFNEAYAGVVEAAGVRRWLESRGRGGEIAAYDASLVREAEFAALLRATRRELARLYRSGRPEAELEIEKQRMLGALKFRYERLRDGWGGYRGYDAWFARTLTNAHLVSVATYHDCVPGLTRELAAAGTLEAFHVRAEELARLSRDERHDAVCRITGGGRSP
jgi:predicted aminopeptidase